ncbi:hypothetical protein MMC25_002896 [Agyrium rufum]|nr:hypothetical protein [Agyrium rufum]
MRYLLPTFALPATLLLEQAAASVLPLVQSPSSPEVASSTPLPLVIWHGLGDNFEADGLHLVGELANETIPGTYVYYIHVGDDAGTDRTATWYGDLNVQLAQVCEDLASHPILNQSSAINGLAFSQGGQFLRGYVERCNNPPVANLVTFGSQHNGIREFQTCGSGDWLCKGWEGLLKTQTWSDWVQTHLVPAQYFRNADSYDQYLESSNFLADINNERAVKNATYKENLSKLENFVMYVFDEDTTVVPKESGWFAEVNATTGNATYVRDRKLYTEDWIGLKKLDEEGKLKFKETAGGHMTLTDELLIDTFKTYFAPPESKALAVDEGWEL